VSSSAPVTSRAGDGKEKDAFVDSLQKELGQAPTLNRSTHLLGIIDFDVLTTCLPSLSLSLSLGSSRHVRGRPDPESTPWRPCFGRRRRGTAVSRAHLRGGLACA